MPITGAVFYAVGWAAATRFYGTFGVAPEDVGIDFSFMLVRTGFLFVASFAVVAIGWRVRHRRLNFAVPPRVAGVVLGIHMLVTFIGGVVLLKRIPIEEWSTSPWVRLITSLGMLAGALALWTVLILGVGTLLGLDRNRGAAGRVMRLGWWLFAPLIAIGAAGATVTPFIVAQRAAASVENGEEFTVYVFPWVKGFSAGLVTLHATSGSLLDEVDGKCLIYLGDAHGTVVLYDPEEHRTIRASQESAYFVDGCD